jgi:hypothetical protein
LKGYVDEQLYGARRSRDDRLHLNREAGCEWIPEKWCKQPLKSLWFTGVPQLDLADCLRLSRVPAGGLGA